MRAAEGSSSSAPARVLWAVEQLRLAKGQRLLEIGCGPGHALALVCRRFEHAFTTGIDRSAIQVERARRLNAKALTSGRLTIEQLSLEAAARTLPSAGYAVALAINVNAFWTAPAKTFADVARLLRPAGSLQLVYEPPSATAIPQLEAKLCEAAASACFRLSSARRSRVGQVALLGAVFQRTSPRSRLTK